MVGKLSKKKKHDKKYKIQCWLMNTAMSFNTSVFSLCKFITFNIIKNSIAILVAIKRYNMHKVN